MATLNITVIDNRSNVKPSDYPNYGILFQRTEKHRTIALAIANAQETVNTMFGKVNFGGSFGNPRWITLHTELYTISFVTTAK